MAVTDTFKSKHFTNGSEVLLLCEFCFVSFHMFLATEIFFTFSSENVFSCDASSVSLPLDLLFSFYFSCPHLPHWVLVVAVVE